MSPGGAVSRGRQLSLIPARRRAHWLRARVTSRHESGSTCGVRARDPQSGPGPRSSPRALLPLPKVQALTGLPWPSPEQAVVSALWVTTCPLLGSRSHLVSGIPNAPGRRATAGGCRGLEARWYGPGPAQRSHPCQTQGIRRDVRPPGLRSPARAERLQPRRKCR